MVSTNDRGPYWGDAARSGIAGDSQSSLMEVTVSGAGSLKFRWQVSSQSNADWLEFWLDGVRQFRISGAVAWEQRTVAIAGGGRHLLQWQYIKGTSGAAGSYAGWVDAVKWIPEASFTNWASAAGLTGGNDLPSAMPHGDGVVNLLKYSFNLNPAAVDSRTLTPGTGTAGLPLINFTGTAAAPVLRVEFLRRIGSGLNYTPQKNSGLSGTWLPLMDMPTVTNMDATWERVVYEESVGGGRWFARVQVALP